MWSPPSRAAPGCNEPRWCGRRPSTHCGPISPCPPPCGDRLILSRGTRPGFVLPASGALQMSSVAWGFKEWDCKHMCLLQASASYLPRPVPTTRHRLTLRYNYTQLATQNAGEGALCEEVLPGSPLRQMQHHRPLLQNRSHVRARKYGLSATQRVRILSNMEGKKMQGK